MAGGTVYRKLQTLLNRVVFLRSVYKQNMESFEQYRKFAIAEVENLKQLYSEALKDGKKKEADKAYSEGLDILINNCDNAPKQVQTKEITNV
ncbi:MAG: hypothetical protein KAS32_29490 [Candidatus Peribacteraceae bacterium]|nr:hypothetical protein [Candidatus Peribacteraceae bacterium]